ncbi:DUF4232 domain-containing protein [Algiphilus sp. W345]|uniref:DUF4232 domain-containing protein n=1 Tax=Banduia mediterranea TaxID=3075609 RepID=A0ABU2WI31_9GAMM|nr:DUF4232 domain-containing protein [Algiphilus sp. W345]MDT0497527.1 DUF4232 domain-containing protein [Algiphilus sp. W345]
MHHRIALLSVVVAICGCTGDHSNQASSAPSTSGLATPPKICSENYLSVRETASNAGAGQQVIEASVFNDSPRTCVLHGYPGLAPLDAGGVRASAIEVRQVVGDSELQQPHAVELKPGASAHFEISFSVIEGESGGCPEIESVDVMAPGSNKVIGNIRRPIRACGAHIDVAPLSSTD